MYVRKYVYFVNLHTYSVFTLSIRILFVLPFNSLLWPAPFIGSSAHRWLLSFAFDEVVMMMVHNPSNDSPEVM